MTTTEQETEVVIGTVDSTVTKGSSKWQAIVKTPESPQYGKKLWHDDPAQNQVVTSLIGQVATFECRVSHYTLPDGKPSSSLWINAINPGAPPPQEPPGAVEAVAAASKETPPEVAAQPVAPPQRDSFGDPRQASIERQVALKCAVELYAGAARTGPNAVNVATILATAEEFDKFLASKIPF